MSTTNKTISIAVPESKEEEEDIAVLIYQDSQRRRRKSEAAAIAAIKKNSDAARRTSSQTASDASTASCNPTLTSTIGKRDATAKRKRHPSSEEDIVRKKSSRKQYRYECSTDGCTNQSSFKGGVCIRHKVKLCGLRR